MRCTLLIPHLIWPAALGKEPYRGLALPGLETLLGRGKLSRLADGDGAAWLCRAFGVARQRDWPVAPLALLADGGNPGAAYWLRADPVHLRLGRDHLALADSRTFSLAQPAATALADALNRHFADAGLMFDPLRPARWYLRLATEPAIATTPLARVAGRNVQPYLPDGADAARWHRVITESQMLLHAHPVNAEREARGEPAINSIWPWGGGTLPATGARPCDRIWSDDPLAIGLARAAGIPAAPLPAAAGTWIAAATGRERHLVVLPQLEAAAQYGDPPGWQHAVRELERSWFAPLAAALRAGRLIECAIVAGDGERLLSWSVAGSDRWKWWRRPVRLARCAQSAH